MNINKEHKLQLARTLFNSGYNCAQAVAGAFEEEMNMPLPLIMRCLSGFGGGMAGHRDSCGAISGMVFVLSTLIGFDDCPTTQDKKALYERIDKQIAQFEIQYESTQCRDLLTSLNKIPESELNKERPCMVYVDACTAYTCKALINN